MNSELVTSTAAPAKLVSLTALITSLEDFQGRLKQVESLQDDAHAQLEEARNLVRRAEEIELDPGTAAAKAAAETSKLRATAAILEARASSSTELASAEDSCLVTDVQQARFGLHDAANRRGAEMLNKTVEAFGEIHGDGFPMVEACRDLCGQLEPFASLSLLTYSRVNDGKPKDARAALLAFEEELELAKPLDGLKNVRLELKLIR